MRKVILVLGAIVFFTACNPQDRLPKMKKEELYNTAPYSLEYLEARYEHRRSK